MRAVAAESVYEAVAEPDPAGGREFPAPSRSRYPGP